MNAKRSSSALTAIQLIFYRISGSKMDPKDKYESDWLGGNEERGRNSVQFGGQFILKIGGTFQGDVTSLQIYPGDP
ncbi:MAG: hypothetical protein O3C40_14530 [Planctomycetota bacterium]|nr:hypothetical protein [Planctomycetota bacterium]